MHEAMVTEDICLQATLGGTRLHVHIEKKVQFILFLTAAWRNPWTMLKNTQRIEENFVT